MGVTAGLTLPIFDSGRLNANLDIASAQNSLSIAQYNKAVVDAVNQGGENRQPGRNINGQKPAAAAG